MDLEIRTPVLNIIQSTPIRETIPLDKIAAVAVKGLDTYSELDRAFAWLLLLRIIPPVQIQWKNVYNEINTTYHDFVVTNQLENWHTLYLPERLTQIPLNISNPKIMCLIHSDVIRTSRLLFFFPPNPLPEIVDNGHETLFQYFGHIRRIERALYIYAIVNPGYSYTQGFNELLIPFYYILLKSNFFNGDLDQVEAFSFQCLQVLLANTKISELYTTQDKTIILHTFSNFEILQKKHIPKIYSILKSLEINPVLYAMRWFTIIFAQEHDLPVLLPIWDSLFANFDDFMNFELYLGLGHLKSIESQINDDYQITMDAIQGMPENTDIKPILYYANEFYKKDHTSHSHSHKTSLVEFFTKNKNPHD